MPESSNFFSKHSVITGMLLAIAATLIASATFLPDLYMAESFTNIYGERTVFSRNWDASAVAAHLAVAVVAYILSYAFFRKT